MEELLRCEICEKQLIDGKKHVHCDICKLQLFPNETYTLERTLEIHNKIAHRLNLRKSISFYNISHLWTKVKGPISGSEISEPEKQFSLWLGKVQRNYPDLIIYDTNGHINEAKLEHCLFPLELETIGEILRWVPDREYGKIVNIAASWGYRLKEKEELKAERLAQLNIFTRPIDRLENVESLRNFDWQKFIDSCVAYKTQEKDPTLKLVHKPALLRGLDIHVNPHGIECTNGGVGKSGFYDAVGENPGKVTAGSFLGFAKSPNEVFPGLIEGSESAIGIDQIESQSASQIMRFMFNALERGYDTVFSGSTRIKVSTTSTFRFLANRIGSIRDPGKSFANLIEHLSFNPAIGRRMAVIVYGDYNKIRKKPKPEEIQEWKERIREFRAVEDYCFPSIQRILHDDVVWRWINSSIPDYEKKVSDTLNLSNLDDDSLRTFLEEHAAGAQARIRGAAVYSALVDSMKDIALDQFDQISFLEDAETYLQEFVEVNLSSIVKICSGWAKEKENQAEIFFNAQADYMQEILSAIEQEKLKHPKITSFLLSTIPYKPKNESYKTLNEAVRKLNKRKDPASTLEHIKRYFMFDFVKKDKDWQITILDSKSNPSVKVLGTLEESLDQIDQ
jgi:hypothetical protein